MRPAPARMRARARFFFFRFYLKNTTEVQSSGVLMGEWKNNLKRLLSMTFIFSPWPPWFFEIERDPILRFALF